MTGDFTSLTATKAVTKHWLGYGWSGQYYFIILFQLVALFALIRYMSRLLFTFPLAMLAVSLMFFAVLTYSPVFSIPAVEKMGDRPFFYWLPYVFVGILSARTQIQQKIAMPPVVVVLLLLLIPVETYFCEKFGFGLSSYFFPSVFTGSIILFGSLMSSATDTSIANKKIQHLVSVVSQNTLGIFCINPLIIIAVGPMIKAHDIQLHFWGSTLVLPLISTLLIMAMCLLVIWILKRLRLSILVAS